MSEFPEWNSNHKISDENLHLLNDFTTNENTSKRNPWSYLFAGLHDCDGEEWHPFLSDSKQRMEFSSAVKVVTLAASPDIDVHEESLSPLEDEDMVDLEQDETMESHVDDLSTEPCVPSELWRLFVCSSQQVESKCEDLQLSSLNEEDTIKFCNFLNGLKVPLVTSLGAILIQCGIFSKVSSLEGCMSRALSTAVLQLAEKFPQCVVEGVLVPSIQMSEIGPYQKDILMKIIKVLPKEYISYTMWNVLENMPAKESVLPFVQTLLERKADLNESCITLLVTKMQNISSSFCENITFGKMLVSVLITLDGQLSENHLQILKGIASEHKTFLTKTAHRLLLKQMKLNEIPE